MTIFFRINNTWVKHASKTFLACVGVDGEDHMYCLCFEAFKKENSKENDMQAQAEQSIS